MEVNDSTYADIGIWMLLDSINVVFVLCVMRLLNWYAIIFDCNPVFFSTSGKLVEREETSWRRWTGSSWAVFKLNGSIMTFLQGTRAYMFSELAYCSYLNCYHSVMCSSKLYIQHMPDLAEVLALQWLRHTSSNLTFDCWISLFSCSHNWWQCESGCWHLHSCLQRLINVKVFHQHGHMWERLSQSCWRPTLLRGTSVFIP